MAARKAVCVPMKIHSSIFRVLIHWTVEPKVLVNFEPSDWKQKTNIHSVLRSATNLGYYVFSHDRKMATKKQKSSSATGDSKQTRSKYSKHANDDAALAKKSDTKKATAPSATLLGKIVLFLIFPTLVGFLGLYMGYLAKKGKPDRELSFDSDFALPFVLALTMSIVIGFQTRGFTSNKVQPLVTWPKVKKRRKIVHKHVVVGQNPDEIEGTVEETEKNKDAKKKD